MAVLQIVDGPEQGRLFSLPQGEAIIGRLPECDVVLQSRAVSRRHARIFYDQGHYYLEDLQSRNGTYLNGTRIESPQPLSDQDIIDICEISLRFSQADPEPASLQPVASSTLVEDNSQVLRRLDMRSSELEMRLKVRTEDKLRALIDITEQLAGALDVEEILPRVLESLFKAFLQADRGFVLLRERPGEPMTVRAFRSRRKDEDASTLRVSRTIVREVESTKEALLSADTASDQRLQMSESIADFQIRSVMSAPLLSRDGEVLGMIQLDTSDQRRPFEEADLEVLVTVAKEAAIAVENAHMHQQLLQQTRLERDLALAREVQRGFLPKQRPHFPGYEFFDYYVPAQAVGGDFFDYVLLPEGRVAVALGDVSGKGVPAAMLMAKMCSDLRYFLASSSTPAEAVSQMAAEFSRHGWDDRFVTMVLFVLDGNTHQVTLVNAGHMPPLLRRRSGEVEEVADQIAGVPVGVLPDFEYEQATLPLAPGELLVAFTDGFSEARNAQDELFGLERVAEALRDAKGDAAQIGQQIVRRVEQFVGDQDQADDMCLVCFGRRAEE